MIEHRVREKLLSDSTLTTLIPAGVIDGISVPRVFVGAGEHSTELPYITINGTSHEPFNTLDPTHHDSLAADSIEIIVYTRDTATCRQAVTRICAVLRDWSQVYSDVRVQDSEIVSRSLDGRQDFGNGDEAAYVGTITIRVYYSPP